MHSSEKLCVQWNDFQSNINSALKELRKESDMTDVTLVSEDGKQVGAHKGVLLLSSPFFMELLRMTKHPNPLIYMRGVTEETLVAMVDFLYSGEANVSQENLDSFLALADDLKLRGLTGSESSKNDQPDLACTKTANPTLVTQDNYHQIESTQTKLADRDKKDCPEVKVPHKVTQLVSVEVNQLDDEIKSMMEPTERSMQIGKETRAVFTCKKCGKEGKQGDIKRHIEANHVTGVTHTCDICGKTSRSKNGLRQHKVNNHSG